MVTTTFWVPRRAGSSRAVSSTIESVATGILCVAIVAGPLALGGTLAWACFGLEAAMATSVILWAVARPRPVTSLVIPLAVAALVLAQLVPLPDRLLTAIAPVSAEAWRDVHEGMPGAWGRISITPAASAAAARRLLLGIATILVVSGLAGDPRRRRWIFTSLATVGGLVWLLAGVLPVDPDNRSVYGVFSLRGPTDYWRTPELEPMQTSGVGYLDWVNVGDQRYQADEAINGTGLGPYIYANHFANAMCLTVPAVCGIWLAQAGQFLRRPVAFVGVVAIVGAGFWGNHAWAASRAGTASLLFGCVVYLILIVESRWLRCLMAGGALVGLLTLLAFMGVLQGPLGGLTDSAPAGWLPFNVGAMQDGRIVAARIAERMFLASPVLGTGLGSYGDLFPRFHEHERIMYFAHNDHAQLWAEAGLVGILAWGCAGCVLVRRLVRFLRERQPASRTVDAAAWAAVAAGVAHSVFDWNMHAPANAFLACIVVGLACSSVLRRAGEVMDRDQFRGSWVATTFFVAAVVWATVLLAHDASLASLRVDLRRAITVARLARSPAEHALAVERLKAALARGEATPGRATHDWQLPVLLGQAQLHLEHAATFRAPGVDWDSSTSAPAGNWFREAKLASPACRGLPQSVSPAPLQ